MAFTATTVWEVQTGGIDDYNAISAVVAVGGAGYSVNDVLTVSGGTSTTAATFTVTAVLAGVVTTVALANAGHYTVKPANPVSTTVAPAGGTLCTLTITWNAGGNGGGFDHGVAGFPTDGACTLGTSSAPVFTSAGYTFVAGDVGAAIYIKAGTNWTFGRYLITSVSGGAATLDATINSTAIGGSATPVSMVPLTVAGCSTVATQNVNLATWGIDYSIQSTPRISFTDMVIDGTTNTKFTSAGNPVGKNYIGNIISVNVGSGFTIQRVAVVSTVTTTATCDKSLGTLSSTGGTGSLGGAYQSVGYVTVSAGAAQFNIAHIAFVKAGTYLHTSATATIPQGSPNFTTTGSGYVCGYSTNRWIGNIDTQPVLQCSGSTITILQNGLYVNLTLDGNNQTACRLGGATVTMLVYCIIKNFNTITGGTTVCIGCLFTGNSNSVSGAMFYTECYSNTATPIRVFAGSYILSYNNTGASTDGIDGSFNSGSILDHCITYNNGRHGYNMAATGVGSLMMNCHAESNASAGYNSGGRSLFLLGCSHYNNGSITNASDTIGLIALTGSAFTNAAGSDFSLNNLASQGAALRAQAYAGFIKNTYPRGLTLTYEDVGAAQSLAASGGSAVAVFGGS